MVNTDWALKSGLTPENRIAQEPIADNPYRNFIAVKVGNENEAWVKTLVASYQNDAVKAEFDKRLQGHRHQRLLTLLPAIRQERRSAPERGPQCAQSDVSQQEPHEPACQRRPSWRPTHMARR